MTCSLTGDCLDVCNTRKYKKGDVVRFGVTGEFNNKVVYLSPPPFLILRTKLPPSKGAGVSDHVFNVEQYFWKN